MKDKEHKIYPYALRKLDITHPNHVWNGDITYIRVNGGFMYLATIIDWYSKAILAWKVSNSMDTSLVTSILKEAIEAHGIPEIFNSDQGSQYTSMKRTDILKEYKIKISMNEKGRSVDNIAIERFFRTLKYDEIDLNEYNSIKELKEGVNRYIPFYNHNRFHSAIGYGKPMKVYKEWMRKAA